jgi:hypothetical protein
MSIEMSAEEIMPDGTKKKIELSKADIGYHNYLVMFNAMIDLDFAILRMIQKEYNNPKYIDQNIMHMTTQQAREALINRESPNPVTVCIKDEEAADSIYKEIMSTRYGDLLKEEKYLAITGVFFLMSVYANLPDIDITVICSNEIEADVIKKYNKKINTVVIKSFSEINVDQFTELIFKNKYDIFKFCSENVIKEKRVLLMNYKFNVSFDDKPYPDAQVSYVLWNIGFSKVALIDTYSKVQKDYATLKFKINN